MTIYVRELCEQIHKGNIELADRVVSILYPTRSITLNRILVWIYYELPGRYIDNAYEFLREPGVMVPLRFGYDVRLLMRKVYSYFKNEQKQDIETRILSYEPEWERHKDFRKYRDCSKHLALSSIPEETLSQEGKKRLQEFT